MPVGTHTWIKNPETGGVWECPNGVLELYLEKRGWELTNEPVDEGPQLAEATQFDPTQHTVAEVNEYLDGLQDSPEEHSRVIALEIAGKNRTSIVGSPDSEKE